MSSKQQLVKLNDGHFIPALGFGTYKPEEVPENKPLEAIHLAVEAGFRHIDTAYVYQTENHVGQAIKSNIAAGIVKREDIFITTKLWCTFHRPEMVLSSLEKSLKNLQLDYVDLYIIHYPMQMKSGEDMFPEDENGKTLFDTVDLCATWEAMEKCKDAGLAKSIGVSNFNRRQLEKILNKPGLKHRPVCNQVECHLYLNQSKLLAYCKMNDIVLVAYGALGTQRYKYCINEDTPVLLDDPILCTMAKKYKRTPALIALRYQLERGIVTLVKSFNEERIRENLQVFDFQLASDDMEILDNLDRNLRYFPANMFKAHPNFPFSDEY